MKTYIIVMLVILILGTIAHIHSLFSKTNNVDELQTTVISVLVNIVLLVWGFIAVFSC